MIYIIDGTVYDNNSTYVYNQAESGAILSSNGYSYFTDSKIYHTKIKKIGMFLVNGIAESEFINIIIKDSIS